MLTRTFRHNRKELACTGKKCKKFWSDNHKKSGNLEWEAVLYGAGDFLHSDVPCLRLWCYGQKPELAITWEQNAATSDALVADASQPQRMTEAVPTGHLGPHPNRSVQAPPWMAPSPAVSAEWHSSNNGCCQVGSGTCKSQSTEPRQFNSWLLHHVVFWLYTNVSEQHFASIFRVEPWRLLLKLTSNSTILLFFTLCGQSSLQSFLFHNSQIQWNVRKRNRVGDEIIFVTLKHIKKVTNVYTGDLVMRLRSNRTKVEDLCKRLHWPIWVAQPLNSWLKPKLKMFTLSLVISIPFNRNCDEQADECGYVLSIFIF
jgi:hypothetical protein